MNGERKGQISANISIDLLVHDLLEGYLIPCYTWHGVYGRLFNTAWEMYLLWYDSYVVGILQWSLGPFIYNCLS
jgi:hypothetical protein